MPVNTPPVPYQPKSTPKVIVAVTLAAAVGIPALLLGLILLLTPILQPATIDAALAAAGLEGHRTAAYVGALAVLALLMVNFGAIFSGVISWYERRIAGRMQSRIGPNRAGFAGFFVWIADAVKLLLKEDLVPADADSVLFRAAPYFVLVGFALTFVVLPFGHSLVVADLNVGIFYVTSVTALVVVGILISGWSSNSKWALFGGMRSAAQVVSYEIPAGIAIMVPVLMAGTLSMQGIIRQQGAFPWQWFVFTNPFALVAFVIFFISQLAEGNRTPFDLPEAESELVAGYLSEYSSFRFALYFLVEFGNLWVMAAVSVTLFFGGWQVPFAGPEVFAAARGAGPLPGLGWWGLEVLSMAVFVVKTLLLLNLIVWIRWTLPRIRIDQMMTLCWKYLVPFAFAAFVATLLWVMLVARVPQLETASGIALTVAVAVVAAFFLKQTKANISAVGDRVDLSNW